ncbi:DNA topoisomerase 3-alpha-like isoform X2 [Halichondria panicea]|uniref:DNA topoisomerase 3-alpha-like isoform X2 n=1 Tax=Halichondria panicea TaxID=6063 RepID=UPI00312BA718
MVMTSVSGHLLSLDFNLAYKNWNNCTPGTLFTADVQRFCPDNFIPIKKTLEREVRGCQHLVLWTDGDREGEGIAAEIVEVVTNVKSRGLQIHRARFSEITHQSIMRACANLGVVDSRVVDAVQVRQELDLRIGCAFTRFQTRRMTKAFPSVLSDQLISYGPCQFPTLGFVVERYKQVQAFIPEAFYKIKVCHEVDELKVEFNWKRVRVFNHLVCLILCQICLENPTALVLGTTSRPRSKWRPLPMDTVELEKLASRKLRISAKETMKIAEKLYTQGYISYPRTETNIFPDSFDLNAIVQAQAGDPQWGDFAGNILTRGATPRQGAKTDNAHPPIHPTKYTNTLQGNEQRIYELVVRHFLACCSQDARGQETTVDIEIAKEKFSAQGLMIIERNYLDVYPYDRWSTKVIPVYNQGSTFQPSSIEMVEGETTPPPLLHEADLITLMEKYGIGTDATHAEHIETIKTRNYVGVQHDDSLVPGELGMGLVEGYDSMGFELSKPQLRAELEADLKRICEGSKTRDDVLSSTLEKYHEVFQNAYQQANKLEESLSKYFGPSQPIAEDEPPSLGEVIRRCPLCQQNDLVIKRKRDGGYMLSCLGFPGCRAVQFFPASVLDVKMDPSLCSTCQPPPVHHLALSLKPGSVPPYLGSQLVGCSSCDPCFRNELDIRPIRSSGDNSGGGGSRSQTSSSQSRGGARGSSSRGANHRGSSSRGANYRGGPSPRGRGSSRKRPHPDSWGGPEDPQSLSAPSRRPALFGISGSLSSADNQTLCVCGEPAILLTVRKEDSSNKGRQFYKCAKRDGGCDFFLWADEPPPTPTNDNWSHPPPSRNTHPSHNTQPSRNTQRSYSDARGSNPITCNCGLDAVQKTVQKDGPNKGKLFHTCSKPRDEQCGYFEWCKGASTSSRGRGRGGRQQRGAGGGEKKTRTCSVCRQPGHTKRSCPRQKELV